MAKRTDHNQAKIVSALRDAGATVRILSTVGGGVPDLLVGWQGSNYLLEVKNLDGRGDRMTKAELKFWEAWTGQAAVVHNAQEALAALRSGVG